MCRIPVLTGTHGLAWPFISPRSWNAAGIWRVSPRSPGTTKAPSTLTVLTTEGRVEEGANSSSSRNLPLLCRHPAHIQPLRDLQKPGVSRCKGRMVLGEACRAQGAGMVSSWASSHAYGLMQCSARRGQRMEAGQGLKVLWVWRNCPWK